MEKEIGNKEENSDEDIPLLKSRKPNERDKFYLNWGLEIIKNQFNLSNELLKQQISLCITLLGVSIIFDKLFENDPKMKFIVVLIFFISLLSAFIGLMPFEREHLWLDSPDDIECFQKDALKFKKRWYLISGLFIIIGLGIIVIKVSMIAFQ